MIMFGTLLIFGEDVLEFSRKYGSDLEILIGIRYGREELSSFQKDIFSKMNQFRREIMFS